MMYNNIRDGSIVTIGDLNLIVRIKNINNQIYYSLYYGDGTLYKSDLNSLNDIGVTKIDGIPLVVSSNNDSFSSTPSGGGNYITRDNLNDTRTNAISNSLGSLEDTQNVIRYCEEVLQNAEIARNGIINTRSALESASLKGYGTEASVSYFNLLSSAIDIAKNNTEITRDASISLNELNKKVKNLRDKYIEKKLLELELNKLNQNKPEYKRWEDENGNVYDNQDEIDAWQRQVDDVNKKINDVNRTIEALKEESDNLYRDISSKYGNLLNLDLDGLEVASQGQSSNTVKSVIDVTNGTFSKNAFTASNGEVVDYFIYVPQTSEKNLPVHLYLTGAGQTGDSMLNRALPKELSSGNLNVGGIVVMPQISVVGYNNGNAVYNYDSSKGENTSYQSALIELLDNVVEQYDADKNRISVSGVSRGAENAYVLVGNNPGYFSSYVAVSGSPVWIGRDRNKWESVANTNLLIVHGTNDERLPIDEHGERIVNSRLRDLGLSNENVSSCTVRGGTHGIDRDIFK